MPCHTDPHARLRGRYTVPSVPVRVFAELDGVRLFARDEQHGARGNRLDVRERVEVHELDVAGERRVRGELRGGAFRSEFPSRRPVECVEFPLDGRGRFRQFMDGAAGVPGFAARATPR